MVGRSPAVALSTSYTTSSASSCAANVPRPVSGSCARTARRRVIASSSRPQPGAARAGTG
jgi:hypothetical protein